MFPSIVRTGRLGLHQRTLLNVLFRSYSPTPVPMPALSPTMEDGAVVKWLLSEGERVDIGDGLCEVETDKAVVTVESVDEGVLAKILVPEGTRNVKINVPIAVIAEEDEDLSEIQNANYSTSIESDDLVTLSAKHDVKPPSVMSLLPSVRHYMHQYKVDLNKVLGSGPKGRILKGDILKFIRDNKLVAINLLDINTPAPADENHVQPPSLLDLGISSSEKTMDSEKSSVISTEKATTKNPVAKTKPADKLPMSRGLHVDNDISNIRNVIAKRLSQSKQSIPHTYTSMECSLDKVVKLRKEFQARGVKLSFNDFVVKAAAMALQEEPNVNSIWEEDTLQFLPESDISVAVATDRGLITPIIRSAQKKGLSQISEETKQLAERAREGKLSPGEFTGGTFTISNLGMFNINHFTAIINPPQTSIMAVGGTKIKFGQSIHSDGTSQSSIIPETVVTVTLSSDARAVDSQMAFNFLSTFKKKIENPYSLGLV